MANDTFRVYYPLSTNAVFLVVNDSPWYCKREADEVASFLGIQ